MAVLRADDLKFDGTAYRQMARVEHEVEQLLMREFAETTEVLLIVFALGRLARKFLRMYPPRMQQFALQALMPFLRGDTRPEGKPMSAEERAHSLLIH